MNYSTKNFKVKETQTKKISPVNIKRWKIDLWTNEHSVHLDNWSKMQNQIILKSNKCIDSDLDYFILSLKTY